MLFDRNIRIFLSIYILSELILEQTMRFCSFPSKNSDTAGTGVANYLAAFEAGVDIVDVAVDSMSGMTSQPTMGGVVAALKHTAHDTGINLDRVRPVIGILCFHIRSNNNFFLYLGQ